MTSTGQIHLCCSSAEFDEGTSELISSDNYSPLPGIMGGLQHLTNEKTGWYRYCGTLLTASKWPCLEITKSKGMQHRPRSGGKMTSAELLRHLSMVLQNAAGEGHVSELLSPPRALRSTVQRQPSAGITSTPNRFFRFISASARKVHTEPQKQLQPSVQVAGGQHWNTEAGYAQSWLRFIGFSSLYIDRNISCKHLACIYLRNKMGHIWHILSMVTDWTGYDTN